jgi:hypothetical protein
VPRRVDDASPFRVTKAGLSKDRPNALFVQLEGERRGDLDIFVEGADFAYFRAPGTPTKADGWFLPFTGDPARLHGRQLKLTMVTPDIALEQDITVE